MPAGAARGRGGGRRGPHHPLTDQRVPRGTPSECRRALSRCYTRRVDAHRESFIMHYLLFYDFVSDYADRRIQHRAEHLRLAEQSVARGELILGGAFAELDGAVLLF